MSSRAPAPASTMLRAAGSTGDLWAKGAELERDFAGYKRRLAERRAHAAADRAGGAEDEREAEERGDGDVAGHVRGRRYEEYVRRRDERLRQEWRARMERKEAEMKALWARLDRAGSRGRRSGDGDLTAVGHAAEQKPWKLEVKVKPIAPVTPRCSPATKLARPRTSMPPSPAAASPRLSTPRRRSSHLHRGMPQAEPPTTPRKENRLPPPSTAAAASAATPRPRMALSRSRSLLKDRGCSSVRESPRTPQFQPPRSSCDSVSNVKEPPPPPDADAIAVMQSGPCFSEHAVLADLKKASAVAPEPFRLRRSGNGSEATSPPLVIPRDEPDCSEIARAGGGNADDKSNDEGVVQSSDKFGSVEITGDSDTEPSYVYIKKDSDDQALNIPATASDAEPTSEDRDSGNVEDAMESSDANAIAIARESPVADTEEASRRASSESLYSNVQSSFSQRSVLNTSATDSPLQSLASCSTPPTVPSPESDAARIRKNPEEEDPEKSLPIPTTPRCSVTVSITVQSPMDAMTGLKRFLTFGKKHGNGGEAAVVVERAPHSLASRPPVGDGSMSGRPSGDSIKARLGSYDAAAAATDDLDNSYVISPHVRSLQSFVPSYPANAELKEAVPHVKSPRVHRSFFSFSSFKSRAN
ncbi:flocculation protein FLO11-like [Phragmites australis]|uniref:flocculation protein FLO11-like n=1 Tax=Phragmites australis TaxID=29695 RepID=UPI002D77262C|nr:flocculation protein FLO11-like [Phragmites australis]